MKNYFQHRRLHIFGAIIFVLPFLFACRQDMYDQPRKETFEVSEFYAGRASAQPLVQGTMPQVRTPASPVYLTGFSKGLPVADAPVTVTRELLMRGRERFNIFCAPCHDQLGTGGGMIVLRGFRPPPSYHLDRLRNAPDGHFFDVMTRGYGTMYSYAARVKPEDRWAITAYIRVLQFSQRAPLTDVPAPERERLLKENP